MKDHWDLGFFCCSGENEKKIPPLQAFPLEF